MVLYFFQMKEAGHQDTTAAIVPVAHSRVRIFRTDTLRPTIKLHVTV